MANGRCPVRTKHLQLGLPAIAIHGGAGTRPRHDDHDVLAAERAGLYQSISAGWDILRAGGSSLDAAIAAVVSMEDSGLFNAGRGAVPTSAGTIETDAGVMGLVLSEGRWREVAGAACAMTWPANPVHVARAVADQGQALLLAGPGADRFAAERGLPERDPRLLTYGGGAPTSAMGTVGAVAVDADGRLAAATSTGGRDGQPPGRVGDTPIIGAGTWAAEGGVAVSATGDGEAFVKAAFAHRIDMAIRAGARLDGAAADAIAAVERWRGTGGAVVLSPSGELVIIHDTPAMSRGWQGGAGATAEIVSTA